MKIQLASDLHLERLEKRFPGERVIEPAPGADLLVLAGDIHNRTKAVAAFADWRIVADLSLGFQFRDQAILRQMLKEWT